MNLNEIFYELTKNKYNKKTEKEVQTEIKNFLNEEDVEVHIHSYRQIRIKVDNPSDKIEEKIEQLHEIVNPSIIESDYCWLHIKDGWYGAKIYWIETGNWTLDKQARMENLKYKSYRL